jgi:hypothetical protein
MRSRRAAAPRLARLPLTRLALAASLLAGLALPALAGVAPAAATAAPAAAVTITSVNPPYARPGQKIRVQGLLRNTTQEPVRGVTVQLRSSSQAITDRDDLTNYATGSGPSDVAEPGALTRIRGPVAPGATVSWSAVLPASVVKMSAFGVYPLAAQASTDQVTLGTSRTFLPFWPTGRGAVRPREDIAWIWPLIDVPRQGPCPGLLDNGLAASLSNSGRLGELLTAGSSAAGRAAKLTWVVDPALLDSAQAMAGPGPYQTGASASCHPVTTRAASAPAADWLSRLRADVAAQPAAATPYADVDIAALVQRNLDGDVHGAFADGRAIASRTLKQNFTPAAAPAGKPTPAALTTALAWPADGLANYPMLETLAAVDGIKTVVLSSSAMPPVDTLPYTPSAVSSTPDGEGGDMRVLLADSTLTQVLGSVSASSDPAGASFAAQQMFLAQTAMIAAEAPHLSRAIVVAPPRRWNPPADLASGVLAATASAPWLTPVSAGQLAASPNATGQVTRQAPDVIGPHLAGAGILRGAAAADRAAALVQSIRVTPAPRLTRAVASVESSAGRDSPAGLQRARTMLRRVTNYLTAQEHHISIIEPGRDTLGGQSGPIPISIDNRLPYPVQVRVQFSVSQDPGGDFAVLSDPGIIRVPADNVLTKKVKVRASSIGSTTVSLRLLAPNGQPLPGPPVNMTVQASHFGTLALVVLAGALAVFVIASASRAIRRGRASSGTGPGGSPDRSGGGGPRPRGSGGNGGNGGPADGAGDGPADGGNGRDGHAGHAVHGPGGGPTWPVSPAPRAGDASATGPGGHDKGAGTDNVGHDRAVTGTAGIDLAATEDVDDYARVTGWADRR